MQNVSPTHIINQLALKSPCGSGPQAAPYIIVEASLHAERNWLEIENFVNAHSEVTFKHLISMECPKLRQIIDIYETVRYKILPGQRLSNNERYKDYSNESQTR